jgi:hypothetical protein
MTTIKCFICNKECNVSDERTPDPTKARFDNSNIGTRNSWTWNTIFSPPIPIHDKCRPSNRRNSIFKPAKPKKMLIPTYNRFKTWERKQLHALLRGDRSELSAVKYRIEFKTPHSISTQPTTTKLKSPGSHSSYPS